MTCPIEGQGRNCAGCREATRNVYRFIWSGIRSLNVGDWLAIACVCVSICAVVFK